MNVEGTVAVVTGANRGVGRALTHALLDRGARTVYAAARDPLAITESGLTPVHLDVTDPDSVALAAETCADATLVINNAGVSSGSPLIGADSLDGARVEMETNYFGTLAVCRAFAPVLGKNGGGALVNVLSVLSFLALPGSGSYNASKAAAWSLTNAVRTELHDQGTLVVGVHAAYVDTDMTARVAGPKLAPADLAGQILDAVAAGREEVLADRTSREVKAALSRDHELLYPDVRRRWAG